MPDTVDHDDLAAEVAGAPKEVHELTAIELRERFADMMRFAEKEVATAVHLVRGGHELAAIGTLNRLHTSLNASRRGVQP